MSYSKRVDDLLGSMTVEEKAGQVFIFTFHNPQQAENDLKLNPGGYVRIYSDALTVARQNAFLQSRSSIPLILTADFERGIGSTVSGPIDSVGNMCLGASGDENLAYRNGRMIAEEARAIGINMNYVPVLDVNINEQNPIINTRAFGGEPELVARLGCAFIRGTQDAGVLPCGKHFPGHGDTQTDTHTSLGVIEADRDRLDSVELLPFRRAIECGVEAIMSAHLAIRAFETELIPATMSRRIMHHLLREELGFAGVTISDALEMGGITRQFPPEEAIVRAFNAGCDQLIMPMDNARAVRILLDAIRDKRIKEERLDEAVARILQMKEKGGLFGERYRVPADLINKLNTPEHYQIALESALAGITLVANRDEVLPVRRDQKIAVVTLSSSEDGRSYFLEPKSLGSHCSRFAENVQTVNCGQLDEWMVEQQQVVRRAITAAKDSDVVIVGAYVKVVINSGSVYLEERYSSFIGELASIGKPVVLISFGNPYLVKQFPEVAAYVCAYGGSEAAQEAAAMLVCGERPFRGKLPVKITIDETEAVGTE